MNTMLTNQEAEILIEKYYEGLTSRQEEDELRIFLQQANLPEEFSAEAALFGYFKAEKVKTGVRLTTETYSTSPLNSDPDQNQFKTPPKGKKLLFRPLISWSVAAAAVVCGVLILNNLNQTPQSAVAYINGVPCTNTDQIKDLAIASIQDVGLETDDVAGSVNHLNDQNMVENQLDLVSIN